SSTAPAKTPPAKTATAPQPKPAGAPAGGAAWQIFKHQTGLSLKYPPAWKAQVVGDALMLVPPDVKQINGGPAEVFLVLSSSAGPVRSGSDPQLEQHVEQQVMQYLPGFTRSGATQSVQVGNEPGILMSWEGLAQGNP